MRETKDKYPKKQFISTEGDRKSNWKAINSLLGRTLNANTTNRIELLPQCGDTSSKFNEQFLNTRQTSDT